MSLNKRLKELDIIAKNILHSNTEIEKNDYLCDFICTLMRISPHLLKKQFSSSACIWCIHCFREDIQKCSNSTLGRKLLMLVRDGVILDIRVYSAVLKLLSSIVHTEDLEVRIRRKLARLARTIKFKKSEKKTIVRDYYDYFDVVDRALDVVEERYSDGSLCIDYLIELMIDDIYITSRNALVKPVKIVCLEEIYSRVRVCYENEEFKWWSTTLDKPLSESIDNFKIAALYTLLQIKHYYLRYGNTEQVEKWYY